MNSALAHPGAAPALLDNVLAGELALHILLKGSVVVVVAWLTSLALRRASAATRHATWSLALVALVAAPLACLLMPPIYVGSPLEGLGASLAELAGRGDATAPATGRSGGAAEPSDAGAVTQLELAAPSPVANATAKASGEVAGAGALDLESIGRVALAVWALGALVVLVRVASALVRIASVTRRARPFEAWPAGVSGGALARELGIRTRVRFLVSPTIEMPLNWGLLRPVVLLPEEAATWTATRLRLVLLHELAHVRRLDYATHILGHIASALYWPNPLAWLAARRAAQEQEVACDDRVLASGAAAWEYAEHLLDIARSFSPRAPSWSGGVAMARRATFKGRIRSILDPAPSRHPVRAAAALMLVALTAGYAFPIASLRLGEAPAGPLPAAEDISDTVDAGVGASADGQPTAPALEPLYLWMEAESGAVAEPMRRGADDGAFGGEYVWAATGEDRAGAHVELEFELCASGEYAIWTRARSRGESPSELFVRIDGGDEIAWIVPPTDCRRATTAGWTWLPRSASSPRDATPLTARLAPGLHTLRIRCGEGETMLDGVLVTSDLGFVPHVDLPPLPPSEPVSVWLEAEGGTESTCTFVGLDADASGGRYIEAPTGLGSRQHPPETGVLAWEFEVPVAGTYFVWGRVIAPSQDADSFWLRLDGGEWIKWNEIEQGDSWRWSVVEHAGCHRKQGEFALLPGRHVLEVAYREEGAKLDRLVISNDPTMVPESIANAPGGQRVAATHEPASSGMGDPRALLTGSS